MMTKKPCLQINKYNHNSKKNNGYGTIHYGHCNHKTYVVGSTGPAGLDGPTGSPGRNGSIGPTGPAGPYGIIEPDKFYDLLEQNNLGEVINSLELFGPTGPQGLNGLQGPQGPTGENGGLSQYAYIYNTSSQTVAANGNVTFDTNGIMSSGITHTANSASINIVNEGQIITTFAANDVITLRNTTVVIIAQSIVSGTSIAGGTILTIPPLTWWDLIEAFRQNRLGHMPSL